MRGQSQTMHAEGASTTERFMRCTVGKETYCLNMRWVRGIRRAEELQQRARHGRTTAWLPYEGQDVPAVNLAERLQLPDTTPLPGGKVVLCSTLSQPLALLVERVDGMINVSSEDVFPLPRLARNPAAPFIESVVKYAGRMLLALSPTGLQPQSKGERWSQPTAEMPDALPALIRVPSRPGPQRKIFCFTTGDQSAEAWPLSFGLSVSQVAHMRQSPVLYTIPGAAPHIFGLTDWQGYPLAVIDLSRRLGGAASILARDSRLLIARATTMPAFVCFPVRPQVRVWSLPLAYQLSDRPLSLQSSWLRGRFDLAHETLVIPDIDRLLVSQEEQRC